MVHESSNVTSEENTGPQDIRDRRKRTHITLLWLSIILECRLRMVFGITCSGNGTLTLRCMS
jgi:hypothetical protein